MTERFNATTRENSQGIDTALDVSSYGEAPYNLFSPFTYSPEFKIPVPEQVAYANSVESIWQGLKLINGFTDFSLFTRRPRKRKGNVEAHLLGKESMDILEARKKIYKPSYFFYLQNYVPEEVKNEVLEKSLDSPVYFYDVEDNLDIKNPSPLAHSVFLKQYFDFYFQERLRQMRLKVDEVMIQKQFEDETQVEPLIRVLAMYRRLTKPEQALLQLSIRQPHANQHRFETRFYRSIEKALQNL
ncbi:hypothetical protein J4218_04085 [Candidatus Pacearchaeota archaeon]|nr:hypothetical protein [Candidatus Pacearchaeota archaeon]